MTFEEILREVATKFSDKYAAWGTGNYRKLISKIRKTISKSDIPALDNLVSNFTFDCLYSVLGFILQAKVSSNLVLSLSVYLETFGDYAFIMYEFALRDKTNYIFTKRGGDFNYIYNCFLEFLEE